MVLCGGGDYRATTVPLLAWAMLRHNIWGSPKLLEVLREMEFKGVLQIMEKVNMGL